jgi:predicted amidohydrolase YtcJ
LFSQLNHSIVYTLPDVVMPPAVNGLLLACLAGSAVCGTIARYEALPVADTLFVNGVIHTLDAKSTTVAGGSLAITNGTITCVGKEEDCRPTKGSATKVVDLKGKAVIPGLIDAHMHPIDAGRAMLGCTLRFQQLTQENLRKIIQACLDSQPGETGLLTVTEFDREGFTAINGPGNLAMLDSLNTTRPIGIIASNQHNIFVNSKTLELLNVTRSTPNPPGGRIGRESNGDLTGFLEENAGTPVRILGGDRGIAQLDAATAGLSELRQKGITSFLDALQTPHTAWSSLKSSGELTARVFSNFGIFGSTDFPTIISQALAGKKQLDEGDLVANAPGQQWRNVKFFIDGVLPQVSESAWVLDPYLVNSGNGTWVPGNNFGIPAANQTELERLITLTLDAGLGLHVHADGDAAVHNMLNAAESTNRTFKPSEIGIAHAELVSAEDRARFGKLGIPVIASYQWAQKATYWAGDNTLALGAGRRMSDAESAGLLQDAGALVVYGSDWPVDPLDPFLALSIGVLRQGDPLNKNSHASFGPQFVGRLDDQPGLSREAALRGMTTAAAKYLNSEASIGSLERGKFADLVVLEHDYFDEKAVPDEQLGRNKVLLTMVGGRAVFADNSTTFLPTEWLAESAKLNKNPVLSRVKPGNILSRSITGRSCGAHTGHAHE